MIHPSNPTRGFLLLLAASLALAALGLFLTGPSVPAMVVDSAAGAPGGAPAREPVQPATGAIDGDAGRSANPTERVAVAPESAQGSHVRTTGRLVDASGRPVAGQELQLLVVLVASDARPVDARVQFLSQGQRKFTPAATTVSAADGTFALLLPAGTAARLRPTGEENVFRTGPLDLEPAAVDAEIGDVVVQRACVLAGVVCGPRGEPCAGVPVLCGADARWFDENSARRVTTGADGSFRFAGLDNGAWRLVCRSPAHGPQTRVVELQPEQRILDLQFLLGDGGAIAGRVVDDAGAPVAGAEVRAISTQSDGGTGAAPPKTQTAADGSFELVGLLDRSYTVRASAKGHRRTGGDPVEVGARGVVVRLQRTASLTGIVVDASGAGVARSRVRAAPASQSPDQDKYGLLFNPGVATGADGRFAIHDLMPGDYRVTAVGSHLDATIAPVHLATGEGTDLRIVVQRGAVVKITVLDSGGGPVAGARVRVTDQAGPGADRPMVLIGGSQTVDLDGLGLSGRVGKAETDAHGIAEVCGLAGGTYRVRVESKEFVQAGPAIFTVAAGAEAPVEVRLAAAGFASVEVVDSAGVPLPGKRVEVEGPLGAAEPVHVAAETDAGGKARLGPFAPGRYAAALGKTVASEVVGGGAVLVLPNGGPSLTGTRVEFDVAPAATTAVRLRRPELATLAGMVTSPRGPVANGAVQIARANGEPGGAARYGLDGSTRSTFTRPDGSFAIADLEPGRYRVRFGRRRQEILAECEVDLAAGQEVPLQLFLRSSTVRVTARDVGGQPLAGAQAKLRRAGDGPLPKDPGIQDFAFASALTAQVRTDERGIAEFADVPPGRYAIEVQQARFVPANGAVEVADGGAEIADAGVLELRPAARLAGRIVDGNGLEVPGAVVEYRAAGASEFKTAFAQNGRFDVDGLEPGEFVLRARRASRSGVLPNAPAGPERSVRIGIGEPPPIELRVPL